MEESRTIWASAWYRNFNLDDPNVRRIVIIRTTGSGYMVCEQGRSPDGELVRCLGLGAYLELSDAKLDFYSRLKDYRDLPQVV